MRLTERIEAFIKLGEVMAEACSPGPCSESAVSLRKEIVSAMDKNRWFTPENVTLAVDSIASVLTRKKINRWLSPYDLAEKATPLTIGVVMAGNLPLVGFHDLISVLVSGNRIKTKISSRDPGLMKSIIEIIIESEPRYKQLIEITEDNPAETDAVIATGSDNTSRYFEYHFGSTPHLFRKNRSSVSIINNEIAQTDLMRLSTDIFSFFGLGCRNISKLLVPEEFDVGQLTECWHHYSHLINHTGWKNNYTYEKAVSISGSSEFHDGGFYLLRESSQVTSPLAVLHYERYPDKASVRKIIDRDQKQIQTIVGDGFTPFGKAQFPELWDYADNIDTLLFLRSIK